MYCIKRLDEPCSLVRPSQFNSVKTYSLQWFASITKLEKLLEEALLNKIVHA